MIFCYSSVESNAPCVMLYGTTLKLLMIADIVGYQLRKEKKLKTIKKQKQNHPIIFIIHQEAKLE